MVENNREGREYLRFMTQLSEQVRIGTTVLRWTHHWDDCPTILVHLESRPLSSGANIITPLSSYRVIPSQPWRHRIYISSQPPHLTFLYHHLWYILRPSPEPFHGRPVHPTTCGAPATTTVSDRWSPTSTFRAPTTWATQRSTSPSTDATWPSRPACPSWFHSQS